MIYSYEDVIFKYKNNYQLDKALKEKKYLELNQEYIRVKNLLIIY